MAVMTNSMASTWSILKAWTSFKVFKIRRASSLDICCQSIPSRFLNASVTYSISVSERHVRATSLKSSGFSMSSVCKDFSRSWDVMKGKTSSTCPASSSFNAVRRDRRKRIIRSSVLKTFCKTGTGVASEEYDNCFLASINLEIASSISQVTFYRSSFATTHGKSAWHWSKKLGGWENLTSSCLPGQPPPPSQPTHVPSLLAWESRQRRQWHGFEKMLRPLDPAVYEKLGKTQEEGPRTVDLGAKLVGNNILMWSFKGIHNITYTCTIRVYSHSSQKLFTFFNGSTMRLSWKAKDDGRAIHEARNTPSDTLATTWRGVGFDWGFIHSFRLIRKNCSSCTVAPLQMDDVHSYEDQCT